MTKREQILLTVVAILFALVGYVYAYQYLSDRTETAQNTNNNLLLQQAEVLTKIAAIPTLTENIESTEAEIAAARENLNVFTEDEDLHRLFVDMAEDAGLTCSALSIASNTSLYQTGDSLARYEAKEVTLDLTGSYEQFIDLVETASKRSDTIVSAFTEDGTGEDASFEITFVMYMEPEADAAA